MRLIRERRSDEKLLWLVLGRTAMNKIVREHYPASKLPKDLRPSDDPDARVTVIIETEAAREGVPTLDEIWAMRRPPYRTKAEIDADLRQQRDEWDD
jgi:hypothetical protein